MTLREFILNIARGTHYRIYQPNRDCLIFESFHTVHTPYNFRDKSRRNTLYKKLSLNEDYWDNNPFCDDVRKYKTYDRETKFFLKKFGNYEVIRVEVSGFRPTNYTKDKDGNFKVDVIDKDPLRPYSDYVDCLDIFII